jgi:enoyl-CoA hydratase
MPEGLRIDRDGEVVVVTFDRPEKRNAFDFELHEAFSSFLYDAAADRSMRALVVTGSGKAFSAGGDAQFMADMRSGKVDPDYVVWAGGRLLRNLLAVPQPVIAAVNGPAAGLGATIALHCDVVFAARRATFSDPHVQLGLVAGDGGAVIWPLVLGPTRAKRYLMTGDPLSAQEAFDAGMVTHLSSDESLLDDAVRFGQRLARGPRSAIEGTKAAVNKLLRTWAETVLSESLLAERISMSHPDHDRRVGEFLEKRFEPF